MDIYLDPTSDLARRAAEQVRGLFMAYLAAQDPAADGERVDTQEARAAAEDIMAGISFHDMESAELMAHRVAYLSAAWQFLTAELLTGAVVVDYYLRGVDWPTDEREVAEALTERRKKIVSSVYENLLREGWTISTKMVPFPPDDSAPAD